MIPTGLRRRPQFMDLLQEIQIDPHKIRYPNRDAKRLRDGFVYSQFDEESNRQMLLQQMNFNVNAYKGLVNRMLAAAGRGPHVGMYAPSDISMGDTDYGDVDFIDAASQASLEAMGAVNPQHQAAAAAASTSERAQDLARDAALQQQRMQTAKVIAQQSMDVDETQSVMSFLKFDPDNTKDVNLVVTAKSKQFIVTKYRRDAQTDARDQVNNVNTLTGRDIWLALEKYNEQFYASDPNPINTDSYKGDKRSNKYVKNRRLLFQLLLDRGFDFITRYVQDDRNTPSAKSKPAPKIKVKQTSSKTKK